MSQGEAPASGRVIVTRDGPVLRVVLSNPGRRNALTWAMYERLDALPGEVTDDVRLVVVRGDGGEAFAAGTDIGQFVEFTSASDGVAYERRVAATLGGLRAIPVPVLGVVEGPAVGAGLAIAAVCDVLVATPGARFGAPIARTLGNCLPADVVRRLQLRLGAARTTAMLLTSRLLDADDAAAAGFVSAVVPREDLDAHVADVERRILAGAPLTLAALKETELRLEAAMGAVDTEDLLARCYGSADFREGVAAFLAHRPPRWQGR